MDPEMNGMKQEMGMDEIDAKNQQMRASEVGALAPEASAPLSSSRLSALAQITADAANKLSGGQLDAQPVPIEGETNKIPDALFAQLTGLAMLTQQGVKELEPYSFDPVALGGSDKGLVEMANTIANMAADEKAVMAMNRPLPGGDQGETPEEDAADTAPEDSKEDEDEDLKGLI